MPIRYDDIKHRAQPPLDCAEIKDLRGQYFHNRLITNYENEDFTGCVLYHCYPSGLTDALEINPAQSEEEVTLKGSDLEEANLEEANLDGACFRGANLDEVNLCAANLEGADFRGASLWRAALVGADLEGADFREANLSNATLEYAALRDADFRGATLKMTFFDGAGLMGADFTGSDAVGCSFLDALYSSRTKLPRSITQEQLDSMVFVDDEED